MRWGCLVALGLSTGCFSITEFPASGTSGGPAESSSSTSGLLPTGVDPPSPGTSTSSGSVETTDESSSSADETGCGFFGCPAPTVPECDAWNNDCAEGEKCIYWYVGNVYSRTRCVPIDPDAVEQGEPCELEPDGFDNCEDGTICLAYGTPTCVPMCSGSPRAPGCDDPHLTCHVWGGPLSICLPQCDPLESRDCYTDASCYLVEDTLRCREDESGDAGVAFDPCEASNACDPGLACVPVETVGLCESGESCCTPFCDLTAPTCPDGTQCVPIFGDEHPNEWQDVGICGQPAE